jgi:hypothetical protein
VRRTGTQPTVGWTTVAYKNKVRRPRVAEGGHPVPPLPPPPYPPPHHPPPHPSQPPSGTAVAPASDDA